MKKQLNWLTMIILSLAVSITAVLIAYSIVDIQREATSERLMDTTQLLLLEAQRLNPEELAPLADTWSNHNGQYRVTFIQKDGTVLGDSSAVDQTMENHSSRPEIMAAWQPAKAWTSGSVARQAYPRYMLQLPVTTARFLFESPCHSMNCKLSRRLSSAERCISLYSPWQLLFIL